ncbi:hypothetical protein [Caulobacter vibrioides]|uniref:Single-stranded DNA-binding protein BPT7 domain-containing protein n=1 Tax=Caulobacter phage S2B TaxID=2759120 RepID=A0AAE7SYL2_9CAUD|nr:hypothetical protein [Caulobacter vibrioides]QOC54163.1 protein of unknown function DUF2815 [Caulobacter phage S2B]QXZ53885.1 hypothetical protein KZH45_09530 [Caulobacter vibrioides]
MSKNDQKILTPKGVAIYPHLNKADTKYNADGRFHTKLALDADDPETQAFVAKLEAIRDEVFDKKYAELVEAKKVARAKEMTKGPVFKVEVDDETGEETGRLLITVAMKHRVVSKKDGKTYFLVPKYFNAKRVQLKNPPIIGSNSLLRCFVEPWASLKEDTKSVNVTLRLDAVQIITLSSFGQRSGADYGFAEEDGDDITDGADTTADSKSDESAPFDEDDDI